MCKRTMCSGCHSGRKHDWQDTFNFCMGVFIVGGGLLGVVLGILVIVGVIK